jgi:hypothetical protein
MFNIWFAARYSLCILHYSFSSYYSGQLIVPILYGGVPDMLSVEIFSHDMSLHLALT